MNTSVNTTGGVNLPVNLDLPLGRVPISTAQQVFRSITISIGILFNCVLLIVILGSRQLRHPRHLFWAAIGLVNQFYLAHRIIELVARIHRNSFACQMYVLNAGVGYSLLLLCLAMAAFDRYLAIARSEWYKEKVTNRVVIASVGGMTFLTYMGITSPFWLGYKKISDYSINMGHIHWVLVWDLLLGIGCVVLHVRIFIKSRALIRRYPRHLNRSPIVIQFHSGNHRGMDSQVVEGAGKYRLRVRYTTNNGRKTELIKSAHSFSTDFRLQEMLTSRQTRLCDQQQQIETVFNERNRVLTQTDKIFSSTFESEEGYCFQWMPQLKPQINRLEIRAALNMSINTIPIWIFTFPITCNGIALYWCTRLGTSCSFITITNPYLRNMFLFHAIYNPVMYMFSSMEFRRALRRLIEKWTPTSCRSAP